MLHLELARIIKDMQRRRLNEGTLPTLDKLKWYYASFRERFGPDVLQGLDGEALLTKMHRLGRQNNDSLAYWLEFKNDEEFPKIFGSISGGSALKFGVYPNAKTGEWMGRGPDGRTPIPITLEEAIVIARRHREQLLAGVRLLEALPANASDDDYRALQAQINQQLPDVGDTTWGHKYLSLLFPDKLDDYHVEKYQRFHLARLLQPDAPEVGAGRFIAAGYFVRIGQELGIPLNHLSTVSNERDGEPINYATVLVNDRTHSEAFRWEQGYEGGYAAIPWPEIGDLSEFANDSSEGWRKLRQRSIEVYPQLPRVDMQALQRFVTWLKPGDVIVAIDASQYQAVGIGRISGGYYFEDSAAPHRLPVDWLDMTHWSFPEEEGFAPNIRIIERYSNHVEIERRLFEASLHQAPRPLSTSKSAAPVRLSGLPGRIQAILDRKGQVILYGPPGTGKTYWAESTACELAARQVFSKPFADLDAEQRRQVFGNTSSYVQLCSFHPAYGYEDFLEGYRPQDVNGQMNFIRQNGIFKQLCERASKDTARNYYLIIDEINRGDIPRIFGELLSVLEKDKRGKSIVLPLSGASFAVPSNVFVIGTMNTADRSIALLDTALRRRFGFIELLPDTTLLRDINLQGIPLDVWLEELNRRILQFIGRDARNLQVGHSYFLEGGKPIADFTRFARVIREDIIPLLEEYCYEDYAALRQILGPTLVDEANQVIHQDLFDAGREADLVQALLESTPDLITLASVTETDEQLDPDALDEDEPAGDAD